MNPRKVKTHIEKWGNYLARRDGGMHCHYCCIPLKRAYLGNPQANADLQRQGFGLATVDHVVPLAKGGSNEPWNMVLACHDCNEAKGETSYRSFMRSIRLRSQIAN